jgi:pilus assembly protein CpaF
LLALRQQIASGLNIAMHQERLRDGSRKILSISEVACLENGAIALKEIFHFQQSGVVDGKITGTFVPTGVLPSFMPELEAAGIGMELFK